MGAKRLLIIGTIFLVGWMFIEGLYYKDAPLMWLAATSVEYAYLRIALIVVLLTLLISSPPRSVWFRFFLASFAAVLGVSTILLSFTYTINIFDAIVFLEASIIFMIEALEAEQLDSKEFTIKSSAAKLKTKS
ncbi:MAG TPA: hypothetical protein VFM68_00125 [Candidatus Saccharimonadales bacterium]|nr:hypothetical protein [Candidatus Saccharimonadales bacterium]